MMRHATKSRPSLSKSLASTVLSQETFATRPTWRSETVSRDVPQPQHQRVLCPSQSCAMPSSTLTVLVAAALIVTLLSVASGQIHHTQLLGATASPTDGVQLLHPSPMSAHTVLSKLCWKNASVRPPILMIAIVAGWGWVVSTCQGARLELDHVLGGAAQSPASTYHAALILFCVLLGAHLVHFVASEIPGVTWRPWLVANLSLNGAFLLLGLLPCTWIFFGSSRLSLVRALAESMIAPFAPVTFWHVIVADYMTSLAKAFSDMQLTACISYRMFSQRSDTGAHYVRSTTLWHDSWGTCADTYYNALFLALPFWWRFMQCLKVYHSTREVKNLWNALKYSTAFPLVCAGYLRRHEPSPFHDQLFVLCAIVQSTYCFIWDVHMDWGLFQQVGLARRPFSGSGYACCGQKPVLCALRDPILILQSTAAHVGLCLFDLGLRFVWALSVFGGVPGRGAGMFFFEVVEILRRTVWAVFRIEWEVSDAWLM